MAVRYAVATGDWSNTATWNGGTLPTSADDVYANGFTVTIDQNATVNTLRNSAQSPAVAGGGFTLTDGVTVTATNGFYNGANVQLITFNLPRGQSASLVGNLYSGLVQGTNASVGGVVQFNNTGTLNVVGNLYSGGQTNTNAITINANGIVNITGDITDGGIGVVRVVVRFQSIATLNITGNVYQTTTGGTTIPGVLLESGYAATINITGNVIGGSSFAISYTGYTTATPAWYLNVVGVIESRTNTANYTAAPAILSNNTNAINIFTGPFICSSYGTNAIMVARMFLNKTTNKYYEFRDSTTNGALPPGAIAPAARFVSPDTVVDAPIPANVRNGVSYALGTFTGTLKVPSPDSVAKDVPTDNTVGTAALKPEDVWNALTSTMTTPDSIGERLKNASTVQTTGDQIASYNV